MQSSCYYIKLTKSRWRQALAAFASTDAKAARSRLESISTTDERYVPVWIRSFRTRSFRTQLGACQIRSDEDLLASSHFMKLCFTAGNCGKDREGELKVALQANDAREQPLPSSLSQKEVDSGFRGHRDSGKES